MARILLPDAAMLMSGPLRRRVAVACMTVGMTVAPAYALHKETPQAVRLTSGDSHDHPATRSWGAYFAFVSDVDLTGEGSTGRQVYVFSLLDYACQKGRPELRPPTETESGGYTLPPCPNPARPYLVKATSADPADNVDNPSVTADGTLVAFDAWGFFNNSFGGDAASRRQVFVKNMTTGKIIPVTGNPDGDSTRPSLNSKGVTVGGGSLAFQSTAALLGGSPGISQVFMYSVPTGQLWQISNGLGPSINPMMNRLGTHVAFQSTADLRGTGQDTGIWQIFWYDRGTQTLFQMTESSSDCINPYLDEKQPSEIYFESAANDLPGTNGGGPGTQIFRVTLQNGELPFVEQMTFGPGNCTRPAVDPNGGRLTFVGDGDILQNGTSGLRLFSLDFRNTVQIMYQITGRGSIIGPVGANLGLWFATFASDEDAAGTGICGKQLFLVDYDPDHFVTPGRVRVVADEVGQAPVEPFAGNPDKSCDDGNSCSQDACINGQTCQSTLLADGTSCGAGDQCTGMAACEGGKCIQAAGLDCDDKNACTTDSCDPKAGCKHDTIDCNDHNVCTADSCDPVKGCQNDLLPSFQGLSCQSNQIGQTPPGTNSKITKALAKAKKLIQTASTKKAKAAVRKLKQADALLNGLPPKIAGDSNIDPTTASGLVANIYQLLAQLRDTIASLSAQVGKSHAS